MREADLRRAWGEMGDGWHASMIRVTACDQHGGPVGSIGVAVEIGENLSDLWQSGDVIAFWPDGEHTVLDGLEFDVVGHLFGAPGRGLGVSALPCPFCGSDNLDVPSEDYCNWRQTHYFLSVDCRACGAHGPWAEVVQRREDGEPYSRDSRMPRSQSGRARWQETIAAGARKALALWNARGSS